MTPEQTCVRAERIDDAVSLGLELVRALDDAGPINSKQIRVIIDAAVRAKVANAAEFEIRDSAKRIMADLEVACRDRQSR